MDSYALLDGVELTPEEQDDSWIARAWTTTN